MAFAQRHLSVLEPIELVGRRIKRYHITIDGADVEEPVRTAAYGMLPRLLPEPDDETPPATFTVLHRSAMGAYLLAYSWILTDVLDLRAAVAGVRILDCPDDDPSHFTQSTRNWIGCVWELAPLEHERSAWVRHVLTPDEPNLDAYLADQHPPGPVGRPTRDSTNAPVGVIRQSSGQVE